MPEMQTVTSRDGTQIAYEMTGEGPPLVFITGAICHRAFRPIRHGASIMSKAFQVVNYDRRGRGDSGDTQPWSLDREVDDLEVLIDAVGGRATLYGHSSGAVLALHAAHRLPSKVDGVVVYDASWSADEAGVATFGQLRSEVESLLDSGRRAGAIKHFLIGIGMPKVFARMLPLMPGWRHIVALAPTLRYDMQLTANPPPLDMAAQIEVPVHVMVGERSPVELHQVAELLAATIPDATHETLAKQDHMVSEKLLLPSLVKHLIPG